MQMTFRWFGDTKDTVSLEQIRQIPGVKGIVPALHTLPAGEVWPLDMIMDMKQEIEAAGLTMECIESVNVHEDIKLGNENADKYIDNYIESIRNLGKAGVRVICYNFMPVFDWTRTDLAMDMSNGATCLSYNGAQIEGKSPEDMFREIDENSNGYAMPGWETERMGEIKELFVKSPKGFTAESGTGILKVKDFSIEQKRDNLLLLTCTDDSSRTASSAVAIRSQAYPER